MGKDILKELKVKALGDAFVTSLEENMIALSGSVYFGHHDDLRRYLGSLKDRVLETYAAISSAQDTPERLEEVKAEYRERLFHSIKFTSTPPLIDANDDLMYMLTDLMFESGYATITIDNLCEGGQYSELRKVPRVKRGDFINELAGEFEINYDNYTKNGFFIYSLNTRKLSDTVELYNKLSESDILPKYKLAAAFYLAAHSTAEEIQKASGVSPSTTSKYVKKFAKEQGIDISNRFIGN